MISCRVKKEKENTTTSLTDKPLQRENVILARKLRHEARQPDVMTAATQ